MSKIIFIVVNYKNHQQTADYVQNLSSLNNQDLIEIVIANNDPDPEANETFKSFVGLSNTRIINCPKNLGYFGAAQFAYEQFVKTYQQKWAWLIVTNSDLKIKDFDFLVKLSQLPQGDKPIVIGPSILSELSGQETNPYLLSRPSTFKMHFTKWVFAFWPICQFYQWLGLLKAFTKKMFLKNTNLASEVHDHNPIKCYAVHGAFMIFSASYFQKEWQLKHPVFLYNEEIFIAENCQKNQIPLYFAPQLQVFHQEHGSIGLFYSRNILKYKAEAAKYFADHYF